MPLARVVCGPAGAAVADLVRLAGLPLDGLEHCCPRCGTGDHGRPVLVGGPHISVARATGLSLLAISEDVPVGVDLEPEDSWAPVDVTLHPDEAGEDALRAWVRKEAVLKAAGTGLAVDPRTVRIVDGEVQHRPGATAYTVEGPPAAIEDLTIPGYVAAVAVLWAER